MCMGVRVRVRVRACVRVSKPAKTVHAARFVGGSSWQSHEV